MKQEQQDVEAQADPLLARIQAGDPQAVTAYADLAASCDWPCHGFASWTAWAVAVRADLAERNLTAAAARLAQLERLPLRVGDEVYQQTML